jgi:hypothetical protein
MRPASATGPEQVLQDLELAARNHALPLEALRYPVTPVGLHYVLTHYDIPSVDPGRWRLQSPGEPRPNFSIQRKDGGPRRLLRVLGRRRGGRFTVLELAPQRRRCHQCLRLVDVPASCCTDYGQTTVS